MIQGSSTGVPPVALYSKHWTVLRSKRPERKRSSGSRKKKLNHEEHEGHEENPTEERLGSTQVDRWRHGDIALSRFASGHSADGCCINRPAALFPPTVSSGESLGWSHRPAHSDPE